MSTSRRAAHPVRRPYHETPPRCSDRRIAVHRRLQPVTYGSVGPGGKPKGLVGLQQRQQRQQPAEHGERWLREHWQQQRVQQPADDGQKLTRSSFAHRRLNDAARGRRIKRVRALERFKCSDPLDLSATPTVLIRPQFRYCSVVAEQPAKSGLFFSACAGISTRSVPYAPPLKYGPVG